MVKVGLNLSIWRYLVRSHFSVTRVFIVWRKLPLFALIVFITYCSHVAQSNTTELISQNLSKFAANDDSYHGDISANGKFIVYVSSASDLVSGDSNNLTDIFLYDVDKKTTKRLSVDRYGRDSNGRSSMPVISGDGHFVAFASAANNLVKGDQNGAVDIFVYNRAQKTLEKISELYNSGLGLGNEWPSQIDISGDGRYVVFDATSDNLVKNDSNNLSDIFLYDRVTEATHKISNASGAAVESDGDSYNAVISENGQFIAFESNASNLVRGDTNQSSDVFVHDRSSGTVTRVSVNSDGVEANGKSLRPQISEDGQFVSFYSAGSNLINNMLSDPYIDTHDGIYLYDRLSEKTELLTLSVDNKWPDQPINPIFTMSANANYIVFSSKAQNIIEYWPGLCTGLSMDACFWRESENIYRYSRLTSHTELISIDQSGFPIDGNSFEASISRDGKHVSFTSSDYSSQSGIKGSQLNLSYLLESLPTHLISPTGDLFEDYPSYTWAVHEHAAAYRLLTPDTLIQPWTLVNDVECSVETCFTTPLTVLDYGPHSVFIQYASSHGEVSPLSEPLSLYKRPATPYSEPLTTDISKPITLTWNEVPDAIDYRLRVRDKTTGETIINYRLINPTVASYTLPFTLNPDHAYEWKVKVQKPNGLYSSWAQITHQATPSIPTPVFPEGKIDDLTPTLQWHKAGNAQKHRILIQNADTGEIIINKTINNDSSYTHSEPLVPGYRYRWKIRSQSPDGEYSQWSYFTLSGVDSPTVPKNSITLTWGVPENRVDGSVLVEGNISHYVVVYQREQDAVEEIIIRDAALTQLAMRNLEDGRYQFKIRVIDNMGLASDFSEGVKIMLPRSTGF